MCVTWLVAREYELEAEQTVLFKGQAWRPGALCGQDAERLRAGQLRHQSEVAVAFHGRQPADNFLDKPEMCQDGITVHTVIGDLF